MTSQGAGQGASGKGMKRTFPRAASHTPLALSCMALFIVFWGLAQADLAVAQFIRTVRLRWLEELGDFGYLLGSGWSLFGLSAVLLAIGLAARRPAFRDAGLYSLAAHVLAGMAVQALKRLVGRPRPRLTHADPFQFAPTLESGLDSLPSGHATASFAVAAVLARSFPAGAWAFYGLAGFVSVTRVARGSHFPTDVVVGSLLGLVIGLAVAAPWGAKWRAIREAVVVFALCAAGVFALVWTALHPSSHPALDHWAFVAGLTLVLAAAATRVVRAMSSSPAPDWWPSLPTTDAVIVLGLAMSTASPMVVLVGALSSAALWMSERGDSVPAPAEAVGARESGPHRLDVFSQIALLVGLALMLLTIHNARGTLPLL